jgi:hypothetical protein
MTRAIALGLGALLCFASAGLAQWTGTIEGRPVTCTEVPGPPLVAPTGGDAAAVTSLGLWCQGTRRHAVAAVVYVTDQQGDLALAGRLCRRGPRPPRRLRARLRQCCALGGGTFTGTFRPAYPPSEQTGPVLLTTGELTALHVGASCQHLTLPVGSVSLALP